MKNLAPVAIFVYNRLRNTKQVIEALKANDLALDTDIFIFSDGAKSQHDSKKVEQVRKYVGSITGFKSVKVIKRPENFYIERNIVDGVTSIINKYGRIIVLEDDGVTSKNFLTFMNEALDFYEKYERVMHIATFTFIKLPNSYNKTFFWSYSENTGGGWGTWKHAWEKFKWFQSEHEALEGLTTEDKNKLELDGAFPCLNNLKLKPIPWDICWYIAIVKNSGLAVNSPIPLIRNNGLFNGTHFNGINKILGKHPFDVELRDFENIVFDKNVSENIEAIALLKEFYKNLGNRKRDKILNFFLQVLVRLKITKLLKATIK